MSRALSAGEKRVDRGSQLMLTRLRGNGWVYAGRLRERADFSENSQVFYRMERYLMPAGLVEEKHRSDHDEPRQFRLTDEGSLWLEQHTEEIATPATREEMRELAREGYEAGTSAKESVQNYRKKLSRLKNRVDDVETATDEYTDQHATTVETISIHDERLRDNRERSKDNKNAISDLQKTRASNANVDGLQDAVSDAEDRLNRVEATQDELGQWQVMIEHERDVVRKLARVAGIGAGSSVGIYVLLLVVVYLAGWGVGTVLLGGVVGLLAVAFGCGVLIWVWGSRTTWISRPETDES